MNSTLSLTQQTHQTLQNLDPKPGKLTTYAITKIATAIAHYNPPIASNTDFVTHTDLSSIPPFHELAFYSTIPHPVRPTQTHHSLHIGIQPHSVTYFRYVNTPNPEAHNLNPNLPPKAIARIYIKIIQHHLYTQLLAQPTTFELN